MTIDSPGPASALFASFHSGRWVLSQIPPPGTKLVSLASAGTSSFSSRPTRSSRSSAVDERAGRRSRSARSRRAIASALAASNVIVFFGSRTIVVVVGDQVGHVGVDEDRVDRAMADRPGLVLLPRLEQAQQVDDLVVAPVADVAPRVVGVGHLPVDAVARDAVGVVAVDRRRVDELGDDVGEVAGERLQQRLPVLEDVAPVALVRQQLAALVVADVGSRSGSTGGWGRRGGGRRSAAGTRARAGSRSSSPVSSAWRAEHGGVDPRTERTKPAPAAIRDRHGCGPARSRRGRRRAPGGRTGTHHRACELNSTFDRWWASATRSAVDWNASAPASKWWSRREPAAMSSTTAARPAGRSRCGPSPAPRDARDRCRPRSSTTPRRSPARRPGRGAGRRRVGP